MIIDENEIGLGFGLNKTRRNGGKGTKVGNAIRRNFRIKNVNVKNIVAAGIIASSFIPAGAVAGKLVKLKGIGKLAVKAQKLASTKVGSFVLNKAMQGIALNSQETNVVNQIAVAQDTDAGTPNVLPPAQFDKITENTNLVQADAPLLKDAPAVVPNKSQLATIAAVKDIPLDNLVEEASNQSKDNPASTSIEKVEVKKNNTLLYAGIGVLAIVGVSIAIFKK